MSSLNHQDFAVVQDKSQPKPQTKACAATITPNGRFTFLSGQVQLANIVPPVPGAYNEVILCFTHGAPGAMLVNGTAYPIKTAYQPITERPILMCYDPVSNYWWVAAVV